MFTSLKNKIREETGNDVCAQHPAFSSNRRNSLSLNNFNNNNNIDDHNAPYISYNMNGTPNNNQHCFANTNSPIDQLNAVITQKNDEINQLIDKLKESDVKYRNLSSEYDEMVGEKDRLEKSNNMLEDALKKTQEQKELIHSEQDKIQNLQSQEISKIKSLLHFREQVSQMQHTHTHTSCAFSRIPLGVFSFFFLMQNSFILLNKSRYFFFLSLKMIFN